MKVAELEGQALDYWVARAAPNQQGMVTSVNAILWAPDGKRFSPSTDWGQGGPIIEREKIAVAPCEQLGGGVGWAATGLKMSDRDFTIWGPTALIAAMRCFVAAKFGDEVPDRQKRVDLTG